MVICAAMWFVAGLLIGYGARRLARAERVYIPFGPLSYQRVGVVSVFECGRFQRLRVGSSVIWRRM